MDKRLLNLADKIIIKLLDAGFVIQRYDAITSNSIYIKLDYGVCNSIRISDHEGKKHLKYRYNIGIHIKEIRTKMDKYPRYYFPSQTNTKMIKQIIQQRKEYLDKYGEQKYKEFMMVNKNEHTTSNGFWKDAKLVTKEDYSDATM